VSVAGTAPAIAPSRGKAGGRDPRHIVAEEGLLQFRVCAAEPTGLLTLLKPRGFSGGRRAVRGIAGRIHGPPDRV
jgi:hypothetical protein